MKLIYYFTADWCQPCKRTRPIVEEIQRDNPDVKFQIVDVDDNPDLAMKFRVASIPTFILYEDKNEIHRIIGGKTRQELEDFINGQK